MLILGIETSCDETGAALIEGQTNGKRVKLLSNVVASSLSIHAKSGGIIPENAAREQVKFIIPVIKKAIEQLARRSLGEGGLNNRTIRDIDAIAVTHGPGLVGSLLIGLETAKTLSYVWGKPLIPVNHLIGHIYANFISEISNFQFPISNSAVPQFPAIALIVSGGHTDLVMMKKHGSIQWLGGTRDDAAGECFDKCARLLGYNYPGGPKIADLAKSGDPNAFLFPRPMLGSHDFEFSFSGLKTAFLNETKQHFPILRTSDKKIGWDQIALEEQLKESHKQTLYDLCASLQQAIIDVLVSKTMKAAERYSAKSILVGGGVAANQTLRNRLELDARRYKLNAEIFAPSKNLCTDNAAMIAAAAFFNGKQINWRKIDANPNLYFNTLK